MLAVPGNFLKKKKTLAGKELNKMMEKILNTEFCLIALALVLNLLLLLYILTGNMFGWSSFTW